MIKIAICDDDSIDLNYTSYLMEEFFSSKKLNIAIYQYRDGKKLIASEDYYDIIFLDILLNNENGVDVAKHIRENNKTSKIIFISNTSNYLKEGYKVRAEMYFCKPLFKTEFFYEMNKIVKELEYDEKFLFSNDVAPFKIQIKNIKYAEFYDRKTILHLAGGQNIYNYCSLKKLLTLIDSDDFVKSHQAFVVNLHYVKQLNQEFVKMCDGNEIPLTRFYKEEFEKAYYKFLEQSR